MNNLIIFILISNAYIINAELAQLAPEHSVQTCFTSANEPAVCVDHVLCGHLDITSPSNCTDKRHVCCPLGNEPENKDAFVVPRWDWTEWVVNWTITRPGYSTLFPPLIPVQSVVSVSTQAPPSIAPSAQTTQSPGNQHNASGLKTLSLHHTSNIGASFFQNQGSSSETISSVGCGARNIQKDLADDLGFIVGGNVAQPHSWPWVAAVYSSGRFICGAAVIDTKYVLCAAHCVSHSGRITRAEQIQILIGAHDRRGTGQLYKVEKILVHSGYNERIMQNDISMFKLATPITFTKQVSPICLPPNGNMCSDTSKSMAFLAGWGTTSAGGSTSNELREVAVPLIPLRDCQKAYDSTMVTSKQICAGLLNIGGKDTCQGDSGGPMVVRPDSKVNAYYQCGIVSWGRGCAESRYPGVYTKVSEFLDWIKSNKI